MKMSPDRLMLVSGLAWGSAFIAARLLLEQPDLALVPRLVLAFGPTIPFVGFLWGAILVSRGLDEMQRRVQLEALACAFGLTLLLIATLALAQRAGFAKYEDFSYVHLLPFLFIFYIGGKMFAQRRYGCETE